MTVCQLCHSLDYRKLFQEEIQELSWLSEDITALYQENSTILDKIRNLNKELENSEQQQEFYDDAFEDHTFENQAIEANVDEVLGLIQQEDCLSQTKDIWLTR